EELSRRAEQEIGLAAQNLVEQFGPHLDVPDFSADVDSDADELPTRPFVRAEVEAAQKKAEREMKRIPALSTSWTKSKRHSTTRTANRWFSNRTISLVALSWSSEIRRNHAAEELLPMFCNRPITGC
ncbi:hypothetical protein, partial [Brevibacterium paucivorans]